MSTYNFGLLLLAVSLVSLLTYLVSLHSLLTQPRRPGLVRTAICRVTAAFMYAVIAMSTLAGKPASILITLSTFTAIQLLWQVNSIADVLLTRQANKHRQK